MNPNHQPTADVVICGAGIAGIAAAYFLTVRQKIGRVVIVDEGPPLALTSDKSTECYRNWWPGPGDTMVRFMNRSIDLLEELAHQSQNAFLMNRRGYVFLTGNEATAREMAITAQEVSQLGAGQLRLHPGPQPYIPHAPHSFTDQPAGADLILDGEMIRQIFPFVTPQVKAMLHTRRCGWLSAQQLGIYLLEQAKAAGLSFIPGRVTAIEQRGNRVTAVKISGRDGTFQTIATPCFVNAAGPLINQVAGLLDLQLPVSNELHGKIAFNDHQRLVPRDVPLMIWNDPLTLPWSKEEAADLASDPELAWLLNQFPAGVHFRPEGIGSSNILLILWTYDVAVQEPTWPLHFDDYYPEVVLRGLSRMIPTLENYFGNPGRAYVDGGYYCKTRENRPLIGPLPVDGAYISGAYSGYGIMAACAGGELLAATVSGRNIPDYAPAFHLSRYDNPAYQTVLANWGASGQL